MTKRMILSCLLGLSLAAPAWAETVKFQAELSGTSEVPPTTSNGHGQASAMLDTETHVLTYDLSFSGFKSPVTMAHFHGPAANGANAGVQVKLGETPASPIHGTATLTAEQQQQLMAGQWYANVHTQNNPKGAIRGQMVKAP